MDKEDLLYRISKLEKELNEKEKEIKKLEGWLEKEEQKLIECKEHVCGGHDPIDDILAELESPELCEDYYCDKCKNCIEPESPEDSYYCEKFAMKVNEDDFCSWFEKNK